MLCTMFLSKIVRKLSVPRDLLLFASKNGIEVRICSAARSNDLPRIEKSGRKSALIHQPT
jgi:hypothetical protein